MSRSNPNGWASAIRERPWPLWAGIFTLAVVVWAGVWEPAHDEGVTWTQALGSPVVPDCRKASLPIGSLVEGLDGADHGLADLAAALRANGMHPPLYYALLQTGAKWTGTRRSALVIPAIAIGLFGLFAMGRVTKKLAPGRSASGLGMALLALSPWFLGYSVFVRPYAFAVVLAIASTWAVLEIGAAGGRGRRRARATAAFVFVSILGIYTLYHYVFVLAWQVLALALLAGSRASTLRREGLWLGVALAAIVLAVLPWLPVLVEHLALTSESNFYFAGLPPVSEWPSETGRLLLVFLLGEGVWSTWGYGLTLAAAAAGAATLPLVVASFVPGSLSRLEPAARFLWWSAPVAPLLILASDVFRDTRTLWISKSAFVLFPLLLLLLARAVQQIRGRGGQRVAWLTWPLIFAVSSGIAIRTSERSYTSHEVLTGVLSFEDAASHHVLLSSTARGYLVPFLLDARKRGLGSLEVSVAAPGALSSCLGSLLADPLVSRVTLIDFDVPYRPEETWEGLPLAVFASHPNRSSWDVAILEPGAPLLASEKGIRAWWERLRESQEGAKRLLLLAAPTKVKYFSE